VRRKLEQQEPAGHGLPAVSAPRHLLKTLGVFVTMLAAAWPALSRADETAAWWSLTAENNNLVVDEDRHYVNGDNFVYLSPTLSSGQGLVQRTALNIQDALPWLFPVVASDSDRRLEWTMLGQQIFTPQNKNLSTPDATDRPYAGWLYTGVELMQNTDGRRYDQLGMTLGVVGPAALGKQVMNGFHGAFGFGQSEGWSHQINDEPALTLDYEHKWRFATRFDRAGGLEVDAIPELGATLGNVLTYGEATGMLRIGRGLDADYGPRMLQPGSTGGGYFSPSLTHSRFGAYLFAGFQQRVVGRNIFLDGNTWRDSPFVDKYPWVHDEFAGISAFGWNRVRADFTYVRRSREFHGQLGDDRYGSATISVRF
jgi:lipid A 3-O-deacylase